ncbi:MAG: chromosome segregation protein SMC [Methanomassiliicoccales archaeon]
MYLKQLELENFKSFGKKMIIPFLEGFSAVTGPNGSGKSNISDAILFVLGPKSSKALRASKLTDLIFNGGPSKQPADYCRVSLVFDNHDRAMPVDSDIVRLTRYVKLSESNDGYNSYFYVNDRKSSLSEFDFLLQNARISADGYNLVQQGDVTRIVTMSPIDRRRILDDISGITKYDEEINRAESERKVAEENIERIGIILEELSKQIKQLEAERAAALKYVETRNKLNMAKVQMAHKRKESALIEIDSIKRQLADYEREIEALKAKKVEYSTKIAEFEAKTSQIENEIERRGGAELKDLKEKMDSTKIEMARVEEKILRGQSDLKDSQESLDSLRKDKVSIEKQANDISSQLQKMESEYLNILTTLDKKRIELKESHEKISHNDGELGELNRQIASLDEKIKVLEEKRSALLIEKDRLQDKVERLNSEILNLEEGKKNLEFEISDADFNIKALKSADKDATDGLKALQEELFQKKNLEVKLSRQAEDLEQAIRRLTREYTQLKVEAEAAESVAKGYNRAVRSLLEARDRREIKGIHGTIAELAEVDPKYEIALNVAAGSRMQSIVVDDDEVAATAIQYLKKNGLGRATFLPLNKMLDGKPRGKAIMAEKESEGFAIDLVRFEEKYRAAFWYVFGDTVVVDTLDKARRLMGGVRLVTLGGDLIEASGAMVGGAVESTQLKFGSAKGKLEELGEELRKTTEHAERVQEELRKVRADLLAVESALREMNTSGSVNEVKISAMEQRRKEVATRLKQLEEELSRCRCELAQAIKARTENDSMLNALTSELEKCKHDKDKANKRIIELAPKELSKRINELQGEVAELTAKAAEAKAAKETKAAELRLLREQIKSLNEEETQIEEKLSLLRSELRQAEEKRIKLTVELNGLRKLEESFGKEMKNLRDQRDELFRLKTQMESERDRLQNKIETSADISLGMVTKQKVAEDRLKEIEAEIATYDLKPQMPLPTLEQLKETVTSCERMLNSMGAVNMRAIEDYETKRTRHEELKTESERLEAQRKDLLKLMRELNERKKEALLKVFEAINENFKTTYAELSGGGEAELILENPEQPFEGGLIMKVRPRNGKVLRLEALSGGEKSLAALAFIFALQQHQPSPFYLLDEVDMFLDAVNADMVAQRVQKSSRTAQFVVISLRKVTLSKADHIIGVTKGESGITNVIMRPNIGDIKDIQEELGIPEEKAEGSA